MSRLASNLIDFYKEIATDTEFLRLIYYTSDPLNPSKQEVNQLSNFETIKKTRIIRAPKTDDITPTSEKICRVCMYFGARSSLNRKLADQDVVFDVYTHIDTYEQNEARSLKIIDRINELLSNSNVTGIGIVKSDRMVPLSNSPSGYIGYRVFYTFGSGKK